MPKYYTTTAIVYTNASPHIGFALELCQADAIARWHGLRGDERFFLTGTDEHGRKVAKAAAQAGKEPREFVDEIAARCRALAEALGISNDDFIRTSDRTRHWPGAQELWRRLEASGDLYKGRYAGLYCEGCEAFLKPSELQDGRCPNHDREPEAIKEENWFFCLSRYGEPIERAIRDGSLLVVPEERKNEALAFIAQGLEDISVSRPRKDIAWGIPVPGDDTQTMYVWVDALSNYISALGYGSSDHARFDRYWPADVHVVGKDILRFHAIIWPALLLSANLPLPRVLLVHGFIHSGGRKMSKSLGNVIDPFAMIDRYGAEAVRYFLLKEIPTMKDGDFTEERFRKVYAADLQHTIGNLVSRVAALGEGRSIMPQAAPDIQEVVESAWREYEDALTSFALDAALGAAVGLARFGNEFIDRAKPWASDEQRDAALPQLAWLLGNLAWALTPFLPVTARTIFDRLGMDPAAPEAWEEKPIVMRKGEVLFPPIPTAT